MSGFAAEFAGCVRTEAVSGQEKLAGPKNVQHENLLYVDIQFS